jgi:vanillate/3-O-methylgallate O-demethylase
MSSKLTCYICDWSFSRKLIVKGPDALKLFSDLSVNSFAKYEIGQAKHVIACNEAGKVHSHAVLMRMSEDEFCVQSRPFSYWAEFKLQQGGYNATTKPVEWSGLQVSGPNALYVVERACGESLRDIKFMHFKTIHIKDREVFVLRQGMAGEIGYELQVSMEYHKEIYDAIMEAGYEFGIRRLGGRTAMINHLEACFPLATDFVAAIHGEDMKDYRVWLKTNASFEPNKLYSCFIKGSFEATDISAWYRSPVELGWAKNIKFDHEFIGRKALEAEVTNPARIMVTLEWNANDVIDVYASIFRKDEHYDFMDIPRNFKFSMYADKVLKNGSLVGVATSRGYSYYFRKMISLCVLDVEYSKPGTEVTVVWGDPGKPQKLIRAKVAPAPYKKDNRRVDVTALPSYLK